VRKLTSRERAKLLRAEKDYREAQQALADARRSWAVVVREVSASAAARELGVTRQAIAYRLRAADRSTGL
jgi:chromosome condensin MukBEF ATPase and DNA-binding subunit MukB